MAAPATTSRGKFARAAVGVANPQLELQPTPKIPDVIRNRFKDPDWKNACDQYDEDWNKYFNGLRERERRLWD